MPTTYKTYTSLEQCRTTLLNRHVVACSTNCFHGGAEESLGTWLDTYTPLLSENERNLKQLSRTAVSQRGN